MSDLFEEVKGSFDRCREQQQSEGPSPVIMLDRDEELAPGFNAMRAYYADRITVLVRRGYRHFAGTIWPPSSDEVLRRTGEVMLPVLIETCMEVFCQGVMIAHRDQYIVKMAAHFNSLEHLYHNSEFRNLSQGMAKGFAGDNEVQEFFSKYVTGGADHVAHITGFAHLEEFNPSKIWDIWMMTGSAVIASGFLAGALLGEHWRERDLLRDIEIDLEEVSNEPGGEDEPDL